jgi:hypothetical protein
MKKTQFSFTLQCTGELDIKNDAYSMENVNFEVNTDAKLENYKHKAIAVAIMANTIEHITGINIMDLIEQHREIEKLY